MIKDKDTKELFEYIRNIPPAEIKNIPSLKSLLDPYSIGKLSIDGLLGNLKDNHEKTLLIDARSEKEFEESSIPYSLSFPVLKDSERHNVGLIYKKYSKSSALWLAMQYAEPKLEFLKEFLENNNAAEKNIFVYCWRGGGRSGYLAKMISDAGFKSVTLISGYKSFRKKVVDFFSAEIFPFNLIELSGLTGCGKTELLKSVSGILPVIDLEESARHFSSLLGHIPYEIKNLSPVKNQTEFENNLFRNIFFNSMNNLKASLIKNSGDVMSDTTYLIESESRKVGKFDVPKNLYTKMEKSPSVRIVCSMDIRIKRIVRDYFGNDMKGIEPMQKIMLEKSSFFKQQLSSSAFDEMMQLLDSSRVSEFTEIMIKQYYDRKYKDKGKKPIAEISTDDIVSAKNELEEIYKMKFL